MKKIRNYKELLFFKESIDLVQLLNNITKGSSKREKEFYHFLTLSLRNLREIETQILISKKLNYISDEEYVDIHEKN
ncbi:MAG: four helix bundle protein [Nanoarchaeota archaeon]|nr:four helix bundle protein [Nanoarchaeota archaeon]